MKFLSHWIAITDYTPRGKTDGNHTSASHVVGCPEKYRGHSTCAIRMKDTGCVNDPMVTKVFACFNMGSHIIRSILRCSIQASLFDGPCFTIMHLRVTHTDVRTGVGGRDRTTWDRHKCGAHRASLAAEVRTERHTVSHNITAFALTL